MEKLKREFYNRDSLIVSKELLGKYLVRNIDGVELIGKIVEVEAYRGAEDKGAHSYKNKRTKRTEIMFGKPGFSYVYLIYGMYNCLNVVCEKEGIPHAVLIRALEPISPIPILYLNRYHKAIDNAKEKEIINLASGPGKLCNSFKITKEDNGKDLLSEQLYIAQGVDISEEDIISTTRIGIDYAEEDKDKPWRFYIKENKFISKA